MWPAIRVGQNRGTMMGQCQWPATAKTSVAEPSPACACDIGSAFQTSSDDRNQTTHSCVTVYEMASPLRFRFISSQIQNSLRTRLLQNEQMIKSDKISDGTTDWSHRGCAHATAIPKVVSRSYPPQCQQVQVQDQTSNLQKTSLIIAQIRNLQCLKSSCQVRLTRKPNKNWCLRLLALILRYLRWSKHLPGGSTLVSNTCANFSGSDRILLWAKKLINSEQEQSEITCAVMCPSKR